MSSQSSVLPDLEWGQGRLWIAGEWREARERDAIAVTHPADGSTLATVANATPEEAMAAVDAAAAAAHSVASAPPRVRAEWLRRSFELMMERKEELARLIALENGKALSDALGEVAYAAEFFRWFAEEAVRSPGELGTAPAGGNQMLVRYQPIGVSLLITPWNFPAAMATRKIAPALAAGCTCVLKPAGETPLTAYAMAAILHEAGVPAGAVNVITTSTSGKVISHLLTDHRVRKLSFTGSTEVGRELIKQAADNIVHCSMELGGNAPFLVFDDADIDAAIDGAMVAKMRNGGQACTAANRFYVQRGVYDEFAKRLTERMAALKLGPGVDPNTGCGPLINSRAVHTVADMVEDAVQRGARVLTGGKAVDGPGCFFQPTVLADVAHGSRVLQEEIFGPVAPLLVFDHEDDAIEQANATEYGLVSYVYTSDLARGLRVCEAIDSGMVALNRGLVSDPAAPFGGMKQSGLGREGSHHGMLEFMECKYIATQW